MSGVAPTLRIISVVVAEFTGRATFERPKVFALNAREGLDVGRQHANSPHTEGRLSGDDERLRPRPGGPNYQPHEPHGPPAEWVSETIIDDRM